MEIDPLTIVYGLVFLGILLAFEGIRDIAFGSGADDRKVSKRMRMVRAGKTSDEILRQLRRPSVKESTFGIPFADGLAKLLSKAGSTVKSGHVILMMAAATIVIAAVAFQFTSPPIAIGGAVFAGVIIPLAILSNIAGKRDAQLVEQLPDALDQMARGLKVGHPVSVTISHVASTMQDPIGTEFGLVADQVAYGEELVAAVDDMSDRLDNEDVRYFAVALGIQHGTGGNLGHVLQTLAKVIRDRDTMRRRIKAISSEGRMTMYIMTALNPFLFLALNILAPDFYGIVMNDPKFHMAMGMVAVLTVANFLVLRRMVNFRI